MFGGFAAVVGRVRRMAVGGMRVMRGFLVVALFMMLSGFTMVMGGVFVVLRGAAMMFGAFVCLHDGLSV
jgi:hypothetical protein